MSAKRANLGQLLLRRFRWVDAALLAELEAEGWPAFRHSHSLVMAYLPEGGIRPAELARRIGISRQALHETLNELKSLDVVETADDPRDRRAQVVQLTQSGRDNVVAALAAFDRLEHELMRRIGHDRVAALRDALEAEWGEPAKEQLEVRLVAD